MKRRTLALAALAVLLRTTPVRAQDDAVTPPHLVRDEGVAYPEEALRDGLHDPVAVRLVLEIDPAGAVTSAQVEAPVGHGFDEAALAAARKLVFEPAQRGGHPIAAKIRFTYSFEAPAPRLSGKILRRDDDRPIPGATVTVTTADGADRTVTAGADGTFVVDGLAAGTGHVVVRAPGLPELATDETFVPGEETSIVLRPGLAARPPPPPAEDVVEITVRGDRPPREVTKRTLTKDEIDHIPGTNGDALRSLQSLPGVARPPIFSTGLVVRGSAPQDTGVFVDGTQIPLIYHFGGLSSVVPTELLEKIDFYPGNYSAVYGRGMGGIVDAGIRSPKKDGYHGFAQLDLIDGRLLAEGKIAEGWTFLAAGRRSWFDLWLTPVLKGTSTGITSAPVYYDWQAEVQKDIGKHQSFRLLFFGGDDRLAIVQAGGDPANIDTAGALNAHTSFWRIQGRYSNDFDAKTSLRAQVAYGLDLVTLGSSSRFIKTYQHPLSGRLELTRKVVPWLTANAGLDLVYEPYELRRRTAPARRPGQPDLAATDTPVTTVNTGTLFLPGMYAELEATPFTGTRLVPGVRVDYDDATRGWDVAPRVSGRQDLHHEFPRTTLKGGVGLFFQPPTPMETDPKLGQVGIVSNRSVHYDVGVEQDVTRKLNLSVDGFAKAIDRRVVAGDFNNGSGTVFGAELLLKWQADEHFFGWLSYTLSRSTRRDAPDQKEYLFQYDQTHVLTVLGSYKLPRGWQVGGRFRLTSGSLDTGSAYGIYDASAGAQLPVQDAPPYSTRLPLFHALDVRVDKVWTFQKWKLTSYFDIQNVYSYQAPQGLNYNYRYTQVSYTKGLPILPSIGIRAEL